MFLNLIIGIVIQNAFYAGAKAREATKRRQELLMMKVTDELVEIFLEVDKVGFLWKYGRRVGGYIAGGG